MNDHKLKLILALLSGLVFSFLFILLAFIVPLEKESGIIQKPQGLLEEVSKSLREKKGK